MAEIVSLVGTTHHPWYHKKTSAPEHELTDDARNLLAWSERVQDSFARTNPDAVVIVGNHRDAWIYGGVDPSSGTAALIELVRTHSNSEQVGWLSWKQVRLTKRSTGFRQPGVGSPRSISLRNRGRKRTVRAGDFPP